MKHVLLVAMTLLAPLSGCAGDEEPAGDGVRDIEVDDNYFEPMSTTAVVGETFRFENEGARDHTVTVHVPPAPATTYEIDGILRPGESIEFTFTEAGTYHVFCRFHGGIGRGMHLNVTVTS